MPTRTIPPYPNGQIPKSKLKSIPGGVLWEPAANAWLDLIDYVEEHEGKAAASALRPGGPDSSYRGYARQVYYKNLWTNKGQPQKAATPGYSNHGLGIAVDIPSELGKAMLRKHGAKFGWSNYEGARIDEDWHYVYCGSASYKRKRKKRPIRLTKTEKFHVERLRAKRRIADRNGGWKKVSSQHLREANVSKQWLRVHANAYAKSKVSDKEYRNRKVAYLRDVALNRNGRGK